MSQPFKIEKGIPIPPPNFQHRKTDFRRALESMEVNDSMLVPNKDYPHRKVLNASMLIHEKTGKKFTSRLVDSDHRRMCRIK